jgi:integrase
MGCKRSEVQILSPRHVGAIPADTVISSRYGGVFYVQDKDNSKMVACIGGASRRVHRLEVTARYLREYIAELVSLGPCASCKDYAPLWHMGNYIPAPVRFELPKLTKKRLPVLTAEQLRQIVKACMVDSGLRRAEVCALIWKGRKDRSGVISANTMRALLAYRRTLKTESTVLFQSRNGANFTGPGLLRNFRSCPSGQEYIARRTPCAERLPSYPFAPA